MKKLSFILLSAIYLPGATSLRLPETAEDKLGFTITLNGGGFNNRTFFVPAAPPGYSNQYFDFQQDPRAKRTWLKGYTNDNILAIEIGVPIHKTPGSYSFIEDSISPYMSFVFEYQKKGDASATAYQPVKLTVTITKYGKVGEYIEGNFSGDIHTWAGERIATTGTFKVKRLKDRT